MVLASLEGVRRAAHWLRQYAAYSTHKEAHPTMVLASLEGVRRAAHWLRQYAAYSTVTLLARFLGLSTSSPLATLR